MRELCKCIPNSEIRLRRSIDIKKIVVQAVEREYTDILVVNEDKKLPNGLLIIHLPDGPTAHFKVTSFKRGYDIKVNSCSFDSSYEHVHHHHLPPPPPPSQKHWSINYRIC